MLAGWKPALPVEPTGQMMKLQSRRKDNTAKNGETGFRGADWMLAAGFGMLGTD
jgi:hypothetical protein